MSGRYFTTVRGLILGAGVMVCAALMAQPMAAQDDDPPAQAGRLSIVNGTVSIQPAGTQDWGQAYLNYPLGPGDRIYTDADGRAEIEVGQTYVRIGPHTDVTFVDFNPQAITFGAAQGELHIRTRGLWDGQALYVQTPSGSTTVTQPGDFRVDVFPDEQTAVFTDFNGDVYVSGANDLGMDTPPGQSLELVGTNPVYPQWLQPAPPDDLDTWSRRRDVQIERAASYRYVSPDAPGAEDLDGYGQWQPGTEYGDMWFPQVDAGWQPYHNGHWMNREPWGWVWVEDEPWGYAPFHYGRWIQYHGRWGWIPGAREEHAVWSPALVVFAGGVGGGGDAVWFPLGPGEAYRPWYRCSPGYIDRVNITNIRETNVVHVQKTYVNIVNVNVTNITYVNRTVGVTAVRQEDFAAGRPVARAAVRVDPQQMQHVQVLARPQVTPTRTAMISAPPARAVPVAASRPVLINAKGMAVAAQPKAQPVPPPQREAPRPPSLPNRAVVAPPPNVKMTPSAQKAMQTAPRPAQQPAPQPSQPAMGNRPGQPGAAPPAQGRPVMPNTPADRPQQIPANPPRPQQIPEPGARPPAQPETPAPARPAPPPPQERPTPPQQTAPLQRLPQNQPAPPPRENQPAPPPVRPQERPAPPPQTAPPPRPEERPAPPPQAQPRQEAPPQRPAPPPQRQEERPAPPPQHAAPPPPPSHQQPPPPEKKKPDEKEKKPEK